MKKGVLKNKKSKLSRRITWRVILIMFFFNLLIIGAVFIFDLAISVVNSEMRAQHLIDGIEGKLNTMVQVVKTTAFNNRVEVEENLDSPEKVFNALERELRVNKRLVGCFAAFEPEYYKKQERWFEAYAYYTDSAHIELKQIGSPQHDYFNRVWYKKGLSLGHDEDGFLTDPYFDNSVGNSMYCSYVLPIQDRQGRKVGIYGVDLNLDWITTMISEEEDKVKWREGVENNTDDPDDDENAFIIQILDSKGEKIAGSETFDDETLKKIQKKDSIGFEAMKLKDITYYVTSKRITNTGWTLFVAQHRDFVYLSGYILGIIILFFMTLGSIVIFFFTNRSIKRATKPLGFLSESAQEVAQGNFNTPLPTFKHQDEIAQLRDSFDTMQQSLKQYVEELKESTASKASIESELNVAHSIQMSMLPKMFPPFPNRDDIELFAIQNPAKAVGGDLYDFFIRNEKLFFCIGDVSGKGVPASLVMAVTRTLFRNIAAHTAEPSHIVETMNINLSEGNDNNMFVTLFVGVLDLQTGHLRYCNAGHDAPYIIMNDDITSKKTQQMVNDPLSLLNCDYNVPIGVVPDWKFVEQETEIVPNGIIFLYTDGLTEAANAQNELFEERRITDIITSFKGTPQELIEVMTNAVHQFVGDTEQSDDLTMLAIKYTKRK